MKTQQTILAVALILATITTSCRNSVYDDLPYEQTTTTKPTQKKVLDTIIALPPYTPQATIPPIDTVRTGSFRINYINNNN